MDKETIKKNWGKRFSKFFRKTKYLKNEYKIIQKDLATTLNISEDTITQWKRGNWDIKLTSIYGVVNYIKERFPESNPMLLLFPDLLEDEIERAVNIKIGKTIEEYKELKKSNKRLKIDNSKLEEKINRITPEYEKNKKDLNEIFNACINARSFIKKDFDGKISKDLYIRLFRN